MTLSIRLVLATLVAGAALGRAPALAQASDGIAGQLASVPLPPAPAWTGPPPTLPPPERSKIPAYEIERKSPIAALAWELIPGAGSLYADDTGGAILTWAFIVGGTGAVIWALYQIPPADSGSPPDSNKQSSPLVGPVLLGGMAAMIFGRIWGFVNAYSAAERYNEILITRLGLGSSVSLSITPWVLASGPNAGLALGGRF